MFDEFILLTLVQFFLVYVNALHVIDNSIDLLLLFRYGIQFDVCFKNPIELES